MDVFSIDNKTLIIATMLVLILMTIVLFIMRYHHWGIKGLGCAITGNILLLLSNSFIYIDNLVDVNMLIIFVSIFDLLGMTFLIVAIFVFFNEKVKRNKYIIINILNTLITIYFFYLNPVSLGPRRASLPLLLIILLFDGLILMRRKYKENKLKSYKIIKYILCVFIAFNFYRILYRFLVQISFFPASNNNLFTSSALFGLLLFFIIMTFGFGLMSMDTLYNDVKQLGFKDPLTGLYNRRYMEEYINNFLKEIKRGRRTFLIALIDIDYFKKINDLYGHNIGDKLLQWFANLLKSNLRDIDVIARYGGDEFIIVLNDTDLDSGYKTLERILDEAKEKEWGSDKLKISFSGSLMEVNQKHFDMDIDELINEVDKKMYVAKNTGRDKILLAWED
ncbi:MAG: GGDEF domain-containing protein [Vulcanibacillus sp.]